MATNFGFKLAQRPVPASPNEDRREQRDNASERKEKKEKKHKKEPKAADAEVMASPEREKKEKKHKKDHSMSSPSLERSRSSTSRSHRKLRGESAPLSLDEQEKLVADLLAAEQQRRQCGDETREAERQRRDAALMAALAAEEERMERVAKNAERMRELSSKLKELATSYETHRVTIASALAPVKEKTEKLQLVQRNAEATRVTLEGMLSLTSLPEKLEPIAKAGPAGELSAFLAKLEEAKSAASLFESARHWKAGDTALLRLKPLITQMTTALDVPYARLLAKCGSAAESRKFAADATERPQLISSKRVEQLRRLISHLSAPYSTVNYLQEYTDSRCKFIRTTLKKLSSDVPPMLADGLGYPRGSHRVIMVTRAVLQLLLHEQWLSGSVLPHTAYDTAQTPITEAAVDALCGEGEMLTKDRGTETILPAMDACQTLSGLLPKFREILDGAETSKALRDVTDLHGRLSATCKRVLVDCEPMIKRGFRTTEIPVDGTVHEQTVNTLSLLRRLVDYQPLLASLLKDEYQTQRGPVKEFYSTLLAELRTQLQERAKKVKPVLAAIFLLNNFHFIAQAARTDLRPLLGDADLTDLESLQASARSSYRHSWNETLEFLWEPKNWQNNTSGKSVVKKKFKGFNSSLESLFAAQRHYAVPDAALRAQIRADIKSVLMPLYENFVQKYGAIDFSKNKGKYVKFSAQTLVAVIDRFFEDQPVAARKTTIASRLSSVAIVGKFT